MFYVYIAEHGGPDTPVGMSENLPKLKQKAYSILEESDNLSELGSRFGMVVTVAECDVDGEPKKLTYINSVEALRSEQ